MSCSHGAFSLDSMNFLSDSVTKSYYAFIPSLPKELSRFFYRVNDPGFFNSAIKPPGISRTYQICLGAKAGFEENISAPSLNRRIDRKMVKFAGLRRAPNCRCHS